jgi:hypothetical protein
MLIHHARKPRGDDMGGAKMSIRGSSGFFDGAQCVLLLSAQKDEPIIVEHEKDRIEGTPCESFGLRIVDTDDRRGLALEFMPPEQVNEPARTRSARAAEEREQRRAQTRERNEAERAERIKRTEEAKAATIAKDLGTAMAILKEIPDCTGRAFRAQMKARINAGSERADAALVAARMTQNGGMG